MPSSNVTTNAPKRPNSVLSDASSTSDSSRGRRRHQRLRHWGLLTPRFRLTGSSGDDAAEEHQLIELPPPTVPLPTRWDDGPESREVPGAPLMEEAMDLSSSPPDVDVRTSFRNMDEVANANANADTDGKDQVGFRVGYAEDSLEDAMPPRPHSPDVGQPNIDGPPHWHDFGAFTSRIPRPTSILGPSRQHASNGGMGQPTELQQLNGNQMPQPSRQHADSRMASSSGADRPQEPHLRREYHGHTLASSSRLNQQHAAQQLTHRHKVVGVRGRRINGGVGSGKPQETGIEMGTLWRAPW